MNVIVIQSVNCLKNIKNKQQLITIPAGPPFLPTAGSVADFKPYPGFGTVRRDDTTN